MSMPELDTTSAFLTAPPALRKARVEMTEDEAVASVAADSPLTALNLEPGTRAVLYLRVSSKGQVDTDYDPEGISLPAQRQSCMRKAEQLGLTVIGEYLEPGRSATEMTKRVEFQRMLERISRQRDIDYVIVHDLSRFARNRIDDAIVMADLKKRGVILISATESIDATPVGQLMHGLLAAFNEYRSAKDGAEVSAKMGQKAMNGGTLGRAPLGYLNVTDNIEGRRINTVAVDPERAPFVKLAFDLYSQGQMTFQDIADELTDRGLFTRATARWPAGPVSDSKIHQMLRDRYYLGEVRYKGEYYEGRHEALIDVKLFDRVQELLDTRGYANERRRKHDHYLKGTIWCGRCLLEAETNRRMILMHVNKSSSTYSYFFCRGTQDHTCDTPYSSIDRVEEAIERHYKTITFRPEFVQAVRTLMEAAVADQVGAQKMLQEQRSAQLTRLATQEDNLIDLAADGGIDTSRVRSKLRDITRQRKELEAELQSISDDIEPGMAYIDAHLELLTQPYELYRHASDATRRLLNQAIFTHIYVVNEEIVGDELRTPMRELLAAQRGWSAFEETGDETLSRELAIAEAMRHSGTGKTKQATVSDGLLHDFTSALLPNRAETVGSCSKPFMVRHEGFEPPTF
jgi:site-specific DNA recombinase